MSINVHGNHFRATDGDCKFFESQGVVIADTAWLYRSNGGDTFRQILPEPIEESILEVIDTIMASGKGDRIEFVELSPEAATKLFLRGGITLQELANATEDDKEIDIPGVTFGSRAFDIRVINQADFKVA